MSQKADAIKAFIDDSFDVLEKFVIKDTDADLEGIGNDIVAFLTSRDEKIRDSSVASLNKTFDPIPTIGIKIYPSGFGRVYLGIKGCNLVRSTICSLPYKDFNDNAFSYFMSENQLIF